MPGRFYCRNAFAVPPRRSFVLAGRVLEGTVRPGMRALIRFNSSVSMALEIAAVEFIGSTAGADVGLVVACGDQDEWGLLRGMALQDEELAVEDPAPSPHRQGE